MMKLKSAAHRYAQVGWPVLPLQPCEKRPLGLLVPHGLLDATTDPEQVERFWSAEPYANIGLRTGDAFDVLDLDGEGAIATLSRDLPCTEPLLLGPKVATARGVHYYLLPTGVGNRKLGPELDYKGLGGYVLAPPSVHPSGTTYRWYAGEDDPASGVTAPIQPAPDWLVELLDRTVCAGGTVRAKAARQPRPSSRARRYASSALQRACARVARAREGERNMILNLSAFRLGQLVPLGSLDVEIVAQSLLDAAHMAGLPLAEAESTVASGLLAGARSTRRS